MRDNHDNAVELLGSVQLAVVNATSANARAVKANLGAALRKVRAGAPAQIVHLSDAVLSDSDFLRDLAWAAETVDPVVFESQRQRFAAAMDRLIYEVGVARIRPSRQMNDKPAPKVRRQSLQRFALAKVRLAATLAKWTRKARAVANGATPTRTRPDADWKNGMARRPS